MNPAIERRLLQLAIAIGGIVPVGAGFWGVLGHMKTSGSTSASQARYLSGLLLGIGLVFWAMIPTVERRREVFRALAAIVVIGGLARLAGGFQLGFEDAATPLFMELGVTPLLALWRERVDRRTAG